MTDNFNGDNAALIRSIEALLALDKAKALAPHGIGGHARQMLTAAATRLTAAQAEADRLRVDAERMDWLQGLPLDADLSGVIHCWQFRGVQYGSLREAMDAAIHAAKTEQETE